MDKKYIINGIYDISISDKKIIFSNNMNGIWIKVPIECYQAIKLYIL
ncbi:hypothetical protein [Romboutsia lituseburensis]|uniref:Uncharacterized protein n=1 Tax=Romboutsia lituseburensis DSM 797 TaxID=1121325 RepID=A0A1G9K9F2_9FIRM|nr:hypothetical protein [Romboutsia lituseburensis]CEH34819.1 Hypothetical protein RLITU_2237 [Romboutsia lituseburensis]SDL46371.1 hypothetical protein SAMN04515677_10259 [Romboutsia lituseburensis DSM 797]